MAPNVMIQVKPILPKTPTGFSDNVRALMYANEGSVNMSITAEKLPQYRMMVPICG